MTEDEFLSLAFANTANAEILARLRPLCLPQGYLTAGCLCQPVWNARAGLAPDFGVLDYDIFYFDPDTSWDAEDRFIKQVAAATADLAVKIDVKNQARVHLWYRDRFGADCAPVSSSQDGISGYLACCTCVGIEIATGAVFAPYGLDELAAGELRMNPKNRQPELFARKMASYRERWPWLKIVE